MESRRRPRKVKASKSDRFPVVSYVRASDENVWRDVQSPFFWDVAGPLVVR